MSTRLPEPPNPPTRAGIEGWLCNVAAELAGVPVASVDRHAQVSSFGVDSATALIITDMLSEWLGIDLAPTLLYEHDTIDALASYLETRLLERGAGKVAT